MEIFSNSKCRLKSNAVKTIGCHWKCKKSPWPLE
jgi:hypothetical protein